MSSNLKRTKVFFVVIACFVTCVVILCSYKVGLTERVYKIRDTNFRFRIPIVNGHVALPDNSTLSRIRSLLASSTREYVNVSLISVKHNLTHVTKLSKLDISNSSEKSLSYIIHDGKLVDGGTSSDSLIHNSTEKYMTNVTQTLTSDTSTEKSDTIESNSSKIIHNATTESTVHEQNGDIAAGLSALQNVGHKTQTHAHTISSFKHGHFSHELRSPEHLKSYLLKLGIPYHDKSEFGGTVRPDSCENCFKNDFKLLLNEPDLCKNEVFLLIMISSTISKRGSRDAIRSTWGKVCNKNDSGIKCVFVFGVNKDTSKNELLTTESDKYHDIIQHEFIDSYANLTYKTLTAMKWADEFCANAHYIMKTDDDMFVNTEQLPVMLQAAPPDRFMGGMCWGPSPPHREKQSKWYVSFQQYSRSSFPAMCSGTGYVMSSDVVTEILQQSKNMPFFYLEDVYIALCLKKLGIRPVLLHGFYHSLVKIDACHYKNRVMTSHGTSQFDLYAIWEGMQKCAKEDLSPEMLYLPKPY